MGVRMLEGRGFLGVEKYSSNISFDKLMKKNMFVIIMRLRGPWRLVSMRRVMSRIAHIY